MDEFDNAAWLSFVSSLPPVTDEETHVLHETEQVPEEALPSLEEQEAMLAVLSQYSKPVCGKRVREEDEVEVVHSGAVESGAVESDAVDVLASMSAFASVASEDDADLDAELVSYAPDAAAAHTARPSSSMSRGKSPRSFEVRSPKSMKKMKFSNEQEEVQVRLFGPNPCRVDSLVRMVKQRKQNAWMKIDELRDMCAEAGYAGKSSVFSSVWCIKSSLYGRNKANGNKCEPWGHFFPYFEVRKDRPIDTNTRRPSTRQVTWVKLSPEFFSSANLSTSQ